MRTLFVNARIFDGVEAECPDGMSVLVDDGEIKEIADKPIRSAAALRVDVGGRTIMPGLIDLHIHAYASDVSVQKIDLFGAPYRTAHAVRMLGHALESGFTTVRDVGGGDWSLWRAIEDRYVRAPRFFYVGKALSMTGGHGDMRHANESQHTDGYCSCGASSAVAVVADGVNECVKAAREELRRGAHCIKIMASGGVASPTDPIWMNQYQEEEIRSVVRECDERRTYVSAHCHPSESIRRSVDCGVRVIEHATLIDDATAAYVAAAGRYVVPTLVIGKALVEVGRSLGFPAQSLAKAEFAFKEALTGLDHMRRNKVQIGFGTDLLGETYVRQCEEFSIRREVFSPLEILRQATSIGADVLMQNGKLGCVKPGALADLLVVDGDPLKDIGLLAASGAKLKLIMRAGELVKNELC